MKMATKRLNGWRRLWIVATVLWVAYVVFYAVNHFPTEQAQLRFWADSMQFQITIRLAGQQKMAAEATLRELRRGTTDEKFIELVPAKFSEVDFTETLGLYKSDMATLPRTQVGWGLLFLGMFLIPPALVYGVGLVIAWIVAGFRKT